MFPFHRAVLGLTVVCVYFKGSSSYGLPAPVAVDYSQGNLPAAFVNSNYQGSQTFPQSKHRKFVVNLILE